MPGRSELLDAMRPEDQALLRPHLNAVELSAGTVIYDPGEPVDHCYFPCGGAIASFYVLFDSGVAVETLMVGREGALGGVFGLDDMPAYARSSVVHGGLFHRIRVAELERIKLASPSVRSVFSRYADCLLAQVFQSVACNASHTIEQRAAKWLIAATERIGRSDITMTQEQLATMMGVGRSYASRVVQRFKADGLVRTRRGGIEVADAAGLEQRACACDHQLRRHYGAVLGPIHSSL